MRSSVYSGTTGERAHRKCERELARHIIRQYRCMIRIKFYADHALLQSEARKGASAAMSN